MTFSAEPLSDPPQDAQTRLRVPLRATRLARRRALAPSVLAAVSTAIMAQLSSHPEVQKFARLGAYWPIRGEPDLRPWLKALMPDCQVFLPVVVAPRTALQFGRWWPEQALSQEALTKGAYGIPAPAVEEVVHTLPPCLLIPCLGFTRAGMRLGYGGGYYDRSLAACTDRPFTIGICHAADELTTLEGFLPNAHDIALDVIVTEAEWYAVP